MGRAHTTGNDEGVGQLQAVDFDAQVRSAGHCPVHLQCHYCSSRQQWMRRRTTWEAEQQQCAFACNGHAVSGKTLTRSAIGSAEAPLPDAARVRNCRFRRSGRGWPRHLSGRPVSTEHASETQSRRFDRLCMAHMRAHGDPVPASIAGSLCFGRCQCRGMVPATIAARSLRHVACSTRMRSRSTQQ